MATLAKDLRKANHCLLVSDFKRNPQGIRQ
jgi:hypothetical protein